MRRPLLIASLAVAAALAAPLVAQNMPQMLTGKGTPADVAAGTYIVEPNHTQVAFSVSHMGISPFAGWFSQASGTMMLDPAHLETSSVTVMIPTDSVMTTSAKLVEELKSADWLDSEKFPTATFQSTKVTRTGPSTARVDGTLTLHGVTRPETMDVRFFGAGANPMSKKASVGFLARLPIKRSEFGVSKYVPMVSDDTTLVINAAFEKQ